MSAPIPIADSPQFPAELMTAAVQQLLDQARALGLTWTLRMATVATPSPLTIVYDGDQVPLNAVGITGDVLVKDQRVYGLIVPPSGNFVIGNANSTSAALRLHTIIVNLPFGASTIVWDTVGQETGGNWIAPGGSTITIPQSGWYAITVELEMAAPGIANSLQYIGIHTTTGISNWTGVNYRASWSNGQTTGTLAATLPFLKDDSLYADAAQTSGGGGIFCVARFAAVRVAGFIL